MTNEVLKTIYERRSVKKYTDKPVPAELLDEILKAGSWAANGKAWQAPVMVAVTDSETREILRRLNATILGNPDADPFYGAPPVVVVLSDIDRFTSVDDGSLVIGNMMLAAHSLGVDSCWIHRAREMFETEEGKALKAKWGLGDNFIGVGNCILGYRDCAYP
ncbi:MAG: nitroreductase, partial [Clostridia bacterium]|nr:nitroreductase [Clostridia bacterium]